ncbi:hypothetical protein GQ53DRAFT_819879 [Thozetella sp. PMI_491]|nr:hypothetical protein GQ53DRAFT_819879 [Thozetella sp. PMI_491]
MDPLTAISLASSIIAFLDVSAKIFKGARDVHSSLSGTTEENRNREVLVNEMKGFSSKLVAPDGTGLVGEERQLCTLAEECRGLSTQIAELLGKIKAKNPKSKTESLWSSVKDKFYEKEKQELEQRLDRCRAQLHLQLTYWTSQDIKSRMQDVLKTVEQDLEKLKTIQASVAQLGQGLEAVSLSPVAQRQLSSVLNMQKDAFITVAQYQVLKMLEFEGMQGRYDLVDHAHYKTFRWIFNSEEYLQDIDAGDEEEKESRVSEQTDSEDDQGFLSPEPDVEKGIARKKLHDWLAAGEGIFHISGKLGSGKSTLMKFLCTKRGTRIELQKWAGQRTLVVANFFFWMPGSPLQKSLAGLCTGLLHSLLKTCPELIPQALPDVWAVAVAAPWQVGSTISSVEAQKAFMRLMKCQLISNNHCFCFFIDGLDEFQETARVDYLELTELLCTWTANAPGQVKLCVSSREYNVFMNKFSPDKRLRLHQLTQRDMSAYVQAKLAHFPNEDREALVEAIVTKAQGIFLWVALVTKFIRDQHESDATSPQLMKELDTLPDELDDLYEHILRSLSPENRKRAYQTLRMLEETKVLGPDKEEDKISISLFAYSFMQEYEQDREFAMHDDFQASGASAELQQQRVDRTQKRLNGSCKGLIETGHDGILDYAHRSVVEFLQIPRIQDAMAPYNADFMVADAVSQLLLAELRLGRSTDSSDEGLSLATVQTRHETAPFLTMRERHKLDAPPYRFLSCFEAALDPIPWENFQPGVSMTSFCVPSFLRSYFLICSTLPLSNSQRGVIKRSVKVLHPLYFLCTQGHYDYPIWKITNDPTVTDTPVKAVALASAVFPRFWETDKDASGATVIDILLERGLLLPSAKTYLFLWGYGIVADYVSLWHQFLVTRILRPNPASSLDARIMEVFLLHKPDLNFSMCREPDSSNKERGMTFVIWYGAGLSQSTKLEFPSTRRSEPVRLLSLREWIEHSALYNKARLLEIYDAQMEAAQQNESVTAASQSQATLADRGTGGPPAPESSGPQLVRASADEVSLAKATLGTKLAGPMKTPAAIPTGLSLALLVSGILLALLVPKLLGLAS